jgi:hypothetical protein
MFETTPTRPADIEAPLRQHVGFPASITSEVGTALFDGYGC